MDFTSAIWSCYRCMPVRGVSGSSCPPTADSKQLLLDSTSDAVAALKADRGVAFAEDSTLLLRKPADE
jgi:hypothetical protein